MAIHFTIIIKLQMILRTGILQTEELVYRVLMVIPFCCTMPGGEIVMGASRSANVFVNYDNLETNTFT